MKNVTGKKMLETFDKVLSKLNKTILREDEKEIRSENIDNVLNTTSVEQELENRNISREEFIKFYEAGRKEVEVKQERILKKYELIENEVRKIFLDQETGKNLQEQGKNEEEKIVSLEKMRKNATQVERLKKSLERWGLMEEIKNKEQAIKMEKFLVAYDETVEKAMKSLKIENDEYKEDIEIFDEEISRIKEELRNIELSTKGYKQVEQEAECEKKLRAKQIRATMFGDEELEKEWDERVKRFYAHRIQVKNYIYKYKKENGDIAQRRIDYETIEEYKELKNDEHFLNLEEYKKYLEIVSMYDAAEKKYGKGEGLNLIKKMLKFNSRDFDEYNTLLKSDSKKADKWLEKYVGEMKEYVRTFHGFTNKYAVKTEVLNTSGSTLKKMKQVRGDLPKSLKLKNGTENILRFFGIRRPEFYKMNSKGEKVATPGKAVLTLTTDLGVVAGIATTAALSGTAGIATWGAAYAAKGVVTAANVIRGKVEYKKHKDEIDANLPTLGNVSKDDKEVVRKCYYREQLKESKGKELNAWNMLTTWAHAKSDRLFFRKKTAKNIEEKNITDRIKISNMAIDKRTQTFKENLQMNMQIAQKNQEIRQENVKRYKSDGFKIMRTQGLREISNHGGTVANTAITIEQKYTAEQQRQDRMNKIWTILLTAGMKVGIDAIRTGFKEQIVTKKEIKTEEKVVASEKQTIPGEKKWVEGQTIQEPIISMKKVYKIDSNKKISDLKYSKDGFNDVYGGAKISNTSRGKLDIDAIVLRTKDSSGKTIEVSIAESGKGFTSNHVHSLTDENISNFTIVQALEKLKKSDSENYYKYVEAIGLNKTSSTEEVAQIALKKGQFFGQTSKLEGWRQVTSDSLKEKVQKVVEGYKEIKTQGHWEKTPNITKMTDVEKIVNGVKEVSETKNVFEPKDMINSMSQGITVGLASSVLEQSHESAKQTRRFDEGTFEYNNTFFFTSRIVNSAVDKLKKQRKEMQEFQKEQQRKIKQMKRDRGAR